MRKYLFLLFLLITTNAHAGGQQTLVTPDGRVLGTASNPLVTTIGDGQVFSVNGDGVTISGTADQVIGDNAKIVFPLSLDSLSWGRIRSCSYGLTNNECEDRLYEETPNRVVHTSSTGLNEYEYRGQVISNALLVGVSSFDVSSVMEAQYRMEENAANTTVDNAEGTAALDCVSSTNTSNLTATGKIGNGFNFTAASSEYLDCGSDSSLKFERDFTFTAWVKTSTTGTTKSIGGNRSSSGNNNGYHLFISTANVATMLVDAGSGATQNNTGTTNVTTGAWFHIAGGRIGSKIFLYVNGVEEGTQSGSQAPPMSSVGNTQIAKIPQASNYFNGDIDDVRIFNRALTRNEILQIYNNSVGTNATSSSYADKNIYVNGGVGSYGLSATGTTGGCILLGDTDGAGYSECCALNGVLSCGIDADGLIDGTP